MAENKGTEDFHPKILVFSTNRISDPGIDLAGLLKLHYTPASYVINLPCSSGIKPSWVLYALQKGFDGVFIAADGTDCSYLQDCTDKTAKVFTDAQNLLKEKGFNPGRLKMAAICSVCAESFLNYMKNFSNDLSKLGSVKKEGRDAV